MIGKYGRKKPYNSFTDPYEQVVDGLKKLFRADVTGFSNDPHLPRYNEKQIKIGELPQHLYIPSTSQSLDIRRAARFTANSTNPNFMTFTSPKGAHTVILGYAVYSDGDLATNQQFIPKVNSRRVFRYHGDPNDGFKINLGLGPDLSNNNIIQSYLVMNPGETFTWDIINGAAVEVAMGVRLIGYIDSGMKRTQAKSGG